MDHHAYYIESQNPSAVELEVKGTKQYFEKFGIDEAKEIINRAQLRRVEGLSVFVIAVSSITSEAQQSLLKLFEEPQPGLTFILILPHGALLPTLRSRMLEYPYEVAKNSTVDAKKFLQSAYKDRSTQVTALLKDDEGTKDRVRALLMGLEQVLYDRLRKSHTKEVLMGLEDIAKVRSYVNDRSPSLKMLLEHLAVSLPKL